MTCPICGCEDCVYLQTGWEVPGTGGMTTRELSCPECGWSESDGYPEPKGETNDG